MKLHESTQRGLCRLTFALLGLLPVLFVVVLATLQFMPSYQRWRAERWESWLSAQLGIQIELASLENKTPSAWVLHGVRLLHPETGATLGRVPTVDVSSSGGRWSIFLHGPELERRQLNATWKMVHDWFLCRPQRYTHAAIIGVDKLTIRGAAETEQFSDIKVRMQPSEYELQLDVLFRLANSQSPLPASLLKIRRQHAENRLLTEVKLQTTTALPCQLFHGLLPHTYSVGESATFRGSLEWQMRDTAWQIQLTNVHLQQVDFGMASSWLANKVSGHGSVFINQASLTDRSLQSATATFETDGPGSISSDLLAAVGNYLDVEVRETNPVKIHGFDKALFSVTIEPQRLRLAGRLENDALLIDGVGPLARRSAGKWETLLPLRKLIEIVNACDDEKSSRQHSSVLNLSPSARTASRWLPLDAPSSHSPEEVSLW